MKRKIMVFLYGMIIAVVFAENNVKLPKTDKVNIEIINTVERNKENEQIYDEVYYPRLSKNKILVNRISFYGQSGKLLYSMDVMGINNIQVNNESNVFLCKHFEHYLQDNEVDYIYLFDFNNGKLIQIDKNIHSYLLSKDGKKVYYISDWNYKTDTEIKLNIWTKNKYRTTKINYKKYTDEICDIVKLKEENESLVLYLKQEAFVMVKLFIDKNGKITNYRTPKRDEDKGGLHIINPDGSIEYL